MEEVAKRKMFDQVRGAEIAKLDLEERLFGPKVIWEKMGEISICGYCSSRSNNTLYLRVRLKVELCMPDLPKLVWWWRGGDVEGQRENSTRRSWKLESLSGTRCRTKGSSEA